MLLCSQRALILVLEHVGNFVVTLPPGCSRHGVSVHCFVRSNVKLLCHKMTSVSKMYASMLCCHCWNVQFERCFADAKLSP